MGNAKEHSAERTGWPARLLLISVGALVAFTAGVLAAEMIHGAMSARAPGVSDSELMVFGAVLAGLSLYGAGLARRGIRGRQPAVGGAMHWLNARLGIGLTFVLAPLLGLAVLVGFQGRSPSDVANPFLQFYGYFGIATLLLPPSIALHEFGHWLGATAAGLPVQSVRVGPIVLAREGDALRVSLDWTSPAGLLGVTRLAPSGLSDDRVRSAVMIAAGPLANLVVAFLCHRVLEGLHPMGLSQAVVRVATYVNGVLCLANLLPLGRSVESMPDGKRLLLLMRRRSPAAKLVYRIRQRWLTTRPRDWTVSAAELLRVKPDLQQPRSTLLLLAFSIAQDHGDDESAEAILSEAFSEPELAPLVRFELRLQRTMREALIHRDPSLARRNLEATERRLEVQAFYPRLAEACVLTAEGRGAEALEALTDWETQTRAAGLQGAFLRIGNQWAIEALHLKLAAQTR